MALLLNYIIFVTVNNCTLDMPNLSFADYWGDVYYSCSAQVEEIHTPLVMEFDL